MNDATRRATNIWSRRIHVYTSMVTLIIVLFFSITGITLNHPGWAFGSETSVTTTSGTFPFATIDETGDADLLAIAEYARSEYGVSGELANYQVSDTGEGSMAFKKPGYGADVLFDTEANTYELTVEQQGWVAVMNDLHKGRDSGSAWKWTIDVTAGFLVVISATGLIMQFMMRKRRRPALTSAVVGGLVAAGLVIWTLL